MARKNKKERNSGLIIGVLDLISAFLMKLLGGGFFARIFTSYDKIEQKANQSIFLGGLAGVPGGKKRSIRRSLLKCFDECLAVNMIRKRQKRLLACKLNVYGTYFATFGIYTLVILIVRAFAENGAVDTTLFLGEHFWGGLVLLLAALPLLSSSRSLLDVVAESALIRSLLEDCAGIPEEKFDMTPQTKSRSGYFGAIFWGILTSALTYFINPFKIIIAIAVISFVCIVFNFPEIGVVSTIFFAPFLGFFDHAGIILAVMVVISALAFGIKLLIGKRAAKLRAVDVAVVIFSALFLLGGIITSGGARSLASALMYVILLAIYFLVVNLMNTKEWLDRCLSAIAIPSGFVAALGILGYTTVNMPVKWIDTGMFANIESRAVATFENPNMLATYLILTAPFIWTYLVRKETSASGRIIAVLGTFSSTACMVLTWSRGGWLGMIAAAAVFLLANYKYTLKYFLVIGLSSPIWISLLPGNITSRFASIGNLADSSSYYRLYTWKGTLRMLADHYLGGIGVGESAFSHIYPIYAYAGTAITAHSHNLFLELAVELGVMGLAVFLLLSFMIAQRGFGCIKQNSENKRAVSAVSAAIAGFSGALVHGVVDHIWYNYRVFFIFWVAAAFICACANVYAAKPRVSELNYKESDANMASLDVIFGNKNEASL